MKNTLLIKILVLALTGSTARLEAQMTESYLVVKGDTLWGVAKTLYGDASKWPEIHELNLEVVQDPN